MIPGTIFLLDTNTISETKKRNPDPTVLSFFDSAPSSSLFLSVMTLGELRKGAVGRNRRYPGSVDNFSGWITNLEQTFVDRIINVDHATATLWGEFSADRTRPIVDTLLVATAIVHGLTLVTRNTIDVQDLPVKLLNPWQS